jgi:hypothetical protein
MILRRYYKSEFVYVKTKTSFRTTNIRYNDGFIHFWWDGIYYFSYYKLRQEIV